MTLTISRVLAWECDDVNDAAAQLEAWSRDVDWLTTDFSHASDLSTCWEGLAGARARAGAEQIATDIKQLHEALADCARRVGAAGDALVDAQRRLRGATLAMAGLGVVLEDDGSASSPRFVPPDTSDLLEIARAERAYNARMAEARRVARDAQEALADAVRADAALRDGLLDPLLAERPAAMRGWVLNEAALVSTGSFAPVVAAARARLADLVAHPADDRDRLRKFATSLSGMNADELEEFFASLSPAEMASLQHFLVQPAEDGSSAWDHGHVGLAGERWHDGLPADDRNALLNHIKLTLSLDSLRALRYTLPVIETDQYLDGYLGKASNPPLVWRDLTSLPFHAEGPPIDLMHDVDQGADGDCWYLSSLNAIARAHPEYLVQHLHHNANGTYTVDFYVKNRLVPVTVLPDVPYQPDDAFPFYAQEGSPHVPVSWAAIYEKAYAQLRAGYQGIDGGWPSSALANLLGPHGDVQSIPVPKLDDAAFQTLKQQVDAGYAVTADSHETAVIDADDYVFGAHSYCVVGVDVANRTITLLNPWGAWIPRYQEATLSFDDFRRYFTDVELSPVNS